MLGLQIGWVGGEVREGLTREEIVAETTVW